MLEVNNWMTRLDFPKHYKLIVEASGDGEPVQRFVGIAGVPGPDVSAIVCKAPSPSRVAQAVLDTLSKSILDKLPIHNVKRVGRILGIDVPSYLHERFGFALLQYFADPRETLEIMEGSGAVISGSFALRFILGAGDWCPGDLDIYVCRDFAALLHGYLTRQGYVMDAAFAPMFPPYNFAQSDVSLISKWIKHSDEEGGPERCIDIIETRAVKPFPPIFRFFFTGTMNFITHNCIYMLYPALTLRKRALLHPRELYRSVDLENTPIVEKWRARGFKIIRGVEYLHKPCGNACPMLWRSIADIGCAEYRFAGGTTLAVIEDLEYTTWSLTRDGDMPKARCPNPYCTRSSLMYERRDGTVPNTPFSSESQAPPAMEGPVAAVPNPLADPPQELDDEELPELEPVW